MIIFLYGPDSYRRQQKAKEIIADYQKKHSRFTLERFDLTEDGGLENLKNFTQFRSLFDEMKLGIVSGGRELDSNQKKDYLAFLKNCLSVKDAVLVVSEDQPPIKELRFLLEKPVLSQYFAVLDRESFLKWVRLEAKKRGLILDADSEELLGAAYNSNSWGLITELDKLALLDEKKITKKILESHFSAALEVNVFQKISELACQPEIGKRLGILEQIYSQSEDPAAIFNILAAWPHWENAEKRKLADYDVAVKSGKLGYDEALVDLVISN